MKKRISILLLILSVATYSFGQSAQVLEKEIMDYAKRLHPNDKKMQRVTYNLQIEGYNYLSTVADPELLAIAEAKYPKDYNMQKLTYDQQVEGKRYMQSAMDEESKQLAVSQYPNDYHMQKYVYERNLEARGYNPVVQMPKIEAIPQKEEVKDQPASLSSILKSMAEQEYPNDLAMQKKFYAEQVDAYKYMKSVTDIELRNSVYRRYPYNYVKMREAYNATLAERASAQDTSASSQFTKEQVIAILKKQVREEYPNDQEKQRQAYNQQVVAYNYMLRVQNMQIKKLVQELYPTDFVTQQEAYDNWIKNLK